ncbi:hypothetical protein [Croceitalea rosinachiae]|uniref:Adhesin domain-containing protein n=1 Tax=Croceitalea rosinachiae TaxID=3075596 RepID=A0ABU3ABE3_9FLAO|nr:hypothetical protein [Croceitalea sp. F388]MDT0607507.1 hypothetical protein [Croceitalea sp. F388]
MDTHYKKVLWLAMVLFSVQLVTGQERVSKTVEKSFSFTNAGALQLENKYGNINLSGWDKNEVSIKISIKVNHRKKDNAKDLLKRVNPKFKSSSDNVSVVSEIANKNTGWFADFFNSANPIDSERSHVQIDYEVFLPKKTKLKVTNRFGDVIIDGWSGQLNTIIEHGDLWLGENLSKADIILKFGKLRAKDMDYASLNLKNGKLEMDNSKSLRLNSSGTEINMNSVTSLEIYSNKDDILATEIGTVYGNLKFSTMEISKLTKDIDLSMKIADFRVFKILEPAAEISIEQESSEIRLAVTHFSHHFKATLEQGLVRLPKSFENVNSNMLDKGRKLREIEATYGHEKMGSIVIQGLKGIITLQE